MGDSACPWITDWNCSVVKADAEVKCNHTSLIHESVAEPGSSEFTTAIVVSTVLLLLAGLFSGLVLGLLSLDETHLEMLIRSDNKRRAAQARTLLPLIKRHHLLLVTLLLGNVAASESLPMFLHEMFEESWPPIVLSVFLILLFGEVIPQAICSRYGLGVGAALAPVVYLLMAIMLPIAWPIAKLLDCLLGHGNTGRLERSQIGAFVSTHTTSESDNAPLSQQEVGLIHGAIELGDKTVQDVMTPLERAFMLTTATRLDNQALEEIKRSGFARIPICKMPDTFPTRLLLTRSLIGVEQSLKMTIEAFGTRPLVTIASNDRLYRVLDRFRAGKTRMAAVEDPATGKIVGIVTLEDLLEALFPHRILDEFSAMNANRRGAQVSPSRRPTGAATSMYMPGQARPSTFRPDRRKSASQRLRQNLNVTERTPLRSHIDEEDDVFGV